MPASSLEAGAEDPEDGELTGSSIVWTSDRQGTLGEGSSLTPVVALVPGTHVITATATDSAGNSASDSVEIVVGAVAADACEPMPREDCSGGKGKLVFHTGSNGTPRKGFHRLLGDSNGDGAAFGDPTASTIQTLCFYENGLLIDALAIPASPTNWRRLGDKGFRLLDPSSDSIQKAVLRAGTPDRPRPATIILSGTGDGLPSLRLPAAVPLTLQLVNDTTDACFASEFVSLRKNGRGLLKAVN